MTRKCPTCAGDGIVVSEATVALQVERRLKALAAAGAGSRVQAYRIALHPKTLSLLAGPGGERLRALEDATRRRFFLVPADGHVHLDHFDVLAEGKRDDLAPQAPLAEGAEKELKLVEIDLQDASAAVGKLDGLDVVVAGAAKLVGKKAKVSVGLVLEGQAFATLLAGEPAAAPITFESEAEKPTRAPARRKADEGSHVDAEPEVAVEDDAVDVEEAPEPLDETAAESPTEDGEAQSPAKKRTRRGSRGGKRRKKPVPAEPTGDDVPAETAETELPEAEREAATEAATPAKPRAPRRRTPTIHVPGDAASSDGETALPAAEAEAVAEPETASEPEQPAGDDGAPARKRTRRGSRGGRNRRKKTPAVNGDGAVQADGEEPDASVEPAAEQATADSLDGESYVPMSEWIEDFDRRA